MRELVFELQYDAKAGAMVDAFETFPELTSSSIASCVDRDCCWIVERFVGPTEALDRVREIRCHDEPREEMTKTDCGATRHATVLERSSGALVTHLFVERLHTCDSVYALAARRLKKGVVIQSRRDGTRHKFRLLVRSEENVEIFYDRLQKLLDDRISVRFGHLGDADQWKYDSLGAVSVPEEQRSTLRAAVEYGYYNTPREITLEELAKTVDLPRSTVSYRLRRAEAELVKGYLGQ